MFFKKTGKKSYDASVKKPMIRASICNGEQVLCAKDNTGHLHELMLIRFPEELEDYCRHNGIDPDSIDKVY